jgi:ABC-type glycerol-3-phosphate transport system substrate-binding protein
MTTLRTVTRRNALQIGAAAAALPLVHIRSAGAAGRLSIGLWDHWVPAGNEAMRRQVQTWAEKNKVDVQIDFITSVGNKNIMTLAAEAQAKTGHDVQTFPTWEVQNHAELLEPADDLMKQLTEKYGQTNQVCEYLAKVKGHWMAVPSSSGTQNKGPLGRISVLKEKAGLDVVAMYPAKPEHTPDSDKWTWDALLTVAESCKKANMAVAIGLGQTTDSVDAAGSLFRAFGAPLVDREGNIQVGSDKMRQLLEYAQKLVKQLPADAVSFDDASNNRALISNKSALIFNPPSAWAVAKRDAPQVAADCWTFPAPAGPDGRFEPYLPYFWGVWKFAQNKQAGKELIAYLCQRPQVEERCTAVVGYDLPPFNSMLDFKVWEEVEPPRGVVYNYPIRPFHNAQPHIAGSEAVPEVAVQIYNRGTMPTMLAKLQAGQSIKDVVAWAKDELEGFTR